MLFSCMSKCFSNRHFISSYGSHTVTLQVLERILLTFLDMVTGSLQALKYRYTPFKLSSIDIQMLTVYIPDFDGRCLSCCYYNCSYYSHSSENSPCWVRYRSRSKLFKLNSSRRFYQFM